jgi:hypothetical protein
VGAGLTAISIAGLIFWFSGGRAFTIPAPSFVRYCTIALTVSVIMAVVSEYRQNIKVVREGRDTSDAMHAFARECAARRLPTLTQEQLLEEDAWEQREYSNDLTTACMS